MCKRIVSCKVWPLSLILIHGGSDMAVHSAKAVQMDLGGSSRWQAASSRLVEGNSTFRT
jgi:hypothetical protein